MYGISAYKNNGLRIVTFMENASRFILYTVKQLEYDY